MVLTSWMDELLVARLIAGALAMKLEIVASERVEPPAVRKQTFDLYECGVATL